MHHKHTDSLISGTDVSIWHTKIPNSVQPWSLCKLVASGCRVYSYCLLANVTLVATGCIVESPAELESPLLPSIRAGWADGRNTSNVHSLQPRSCARGCCAMCSGVVLHWCNTVHCTDVVLHWCNTVHCTDVVLQWCNTVHCIDVVLHCSNMVHCTDVVLHWWYTVK